MRNLRGDGAPRPCSGAAAGSALAWRAARFGGFFPPPPAALWPPRADGRCRLFGLFDAIEAPLLFPFFFLVTHFSGLDGISRYLGVAGPSNVAATSPWAPEEATDAATAALLLHPSLAWRPLLSNMFAGSTFW